MTGTTFRSCRTSSQLATYLRALFRNSNEFAHLSQYELDYVQKLANVIPPRVVLTSTELDRYQRPLLAAMVIVNQLPKWPAPYRHLDWRQVEAYRFPVLDRLAELDAQLPTFLHDASPCVWPGEDLYCLAVADGSTNWLSKLEDKDTKVTIEDSGPNSVELQVTSPSKSQCRVWLETYAGRHFVRSAGPPIPIHRLSGPAIANLRDLLQRSSAKTASSKKRTLHARSDNIARYIDELPQARYLTENVKKAIKSLRVQYKFDTVRGEPSTMFAIGHAVNPQASPAPAPEPERNAPTPA